NTSSARRSAPAAPPASEHAQMLASSRAIGRSPAPARAAIMFGGNAREGNDHARDLRLRRAREAAVGAYQRQNRAPRSRGQAWNDRVVENQGGRACRCASASARADGLYAQG